MEVIDFLTQYAHVHASWMGMLHYYIMEQLCMQVNQTLKVADLKRVEVDKLLKVENEYFNQCLSLYKDAIKAAIARIPADDEYDE